MRVRRSGMTERVCVLAQSFKTDHPRLKRGQGGNAPGMDHRRLRNESRLNPKQTVFGITSPGPDSPSLDCGHPEERGSPLLKLHG